MAKHGPLRQSAQIKARKANKVRAAKGAVLNGPAPMSYKGYEVKTVAQVVKELRDERARHGPYRTSRMW